MNPVLDICTDTIKINKQAIVFCNSKRSAEKQAEDIAKSKQVKDLNKNIEVLEKLANEFSHSLSSPTRQCARGAFCIRQGSAFHHAGLTAKQRQLIEDNFRNGNIKIICSTPTLAAGLSMPAFRTVLKDLKRYTGKWGMQYIPVLEYEQMAGRAGRPEHEDYGEAIAIATTQNDKDAIKDNYIFGDIEDIQSKLAVEPVLRCHILSLVATGFASSRKQLLDFFKKTFHAHQFKDEGGLKLLIDKVIDLLISYEFLKSDAKITTDRKEDLFSSAFDLTDTSKDSNIEATPIGKIVSNLYLDPYTAKHLIDCLKVADTNYKHLTGEKGLFSLFQAICYTLEMEPLLRLKASEQDVIFSLASEHEALFFMDIPDGFEYDDFLRSVKTALFFKSWVNEAEEELLLESYNIRPGEIRGKLNVMDWLMRCSIELSRSKGYFEIIKDLTKLQVRLKYGVKEELLPLLRLKGVGRVRARKLANENIRALKDIKYLELAKLERILGKKIAESVLAQVGKDTKHGQYFID